MKLLKDWRKIDVNGEPVLQHVNLLNQKTTADDDELHERHWYAYSYTENNLKSIQTADYRHCVLLHKQSNKVFISCCTCLMLVVKEHILYLHTFNRRRDNGLT